MSQPTTNSSLDFSYLAVILLLAYVLTSAPKYVKQFRQHHEDIKIESVSPIKAVMEIGKAYAIDPYLRAWNHLKSADLNLALADR